MAESGNRVSEDAIRQRSYEIWESEGRPAGRAEAHWQRAKSELEAKLATNIALPNPAVVVIPRVPVRARPNRRVASKIDARVA